MVIDEVLAPAGHDLRHGDEKKCKRAWGGTNEAYSRCSCLVSLVMGLAGWVYSHSMAQSQINHRKSTRTWRFHKTTGGGPGALFFSSPMPEPEESPPRTPIGGHLPNCGLLERNAAGGMAPQPVGERSVNLATDRVPPAPPVPCTPAVFFGCCAAY